MGLFSTKKKHHVDTSVVRIMENDLIPDILQTAVAEAIFTGGSVTTSVLNGMLNNNSRNFERAYRYAASGDYFYGLPNTRILSSNDGIALAEAAMTADVGETLVVEYLQFRPLNNVHAGFQYMSETWGFDPEANTVTNYPGATGKTVYLEKMVAVHETSLGAEPEMSSLGTWGASTQSGVTPERTPRPELVNDEELRIGENETESVELHLLLSDDTTEAITRTVEIVDLSAFDTDQEYYQAKYRYEVGGNWVYGYWTYNTREARFPDLDAVFLEPTFINPGTYFPITVFRKGDVNRADLSLAETAEYKSSVKLMKYLGMDFQEMGDQIHENPGIDDIRQAVMLMAVPITADTQVEMDYLFRFFKALAARIPSYSAGDELSNGAALSGAPQESYALRIADADFETTISLDRIATRLVGGSIGDIGTCTNSTELVSSDTQWTGNIQLRTIGAQVVHTGRRFFRKQITEAIYEEVEVFNPSIRFEIYGDKGVEGGATDERFLIPLDYEIASEFTILEKEDLYHRSLHLVFNSHIVEKTKWYESGVFQIFMVVVAVVLAVWSYGASLKLLYAGLVAGGTAATAALIVFLKTVLTFLVQAVVLKWAFTEVVALIGTDWAIVLAAVAIMYGGYTMLKDGSWLLNATAETMLQLSSNLMVGVSGHLKNEFSDYMNELREFNIFKEGKWEELEEANKLLGGPNLLDADLFIRAEPLVIPGEGPDAFYNRTVHSGNLGAESLNFIQNFVDISLRLPEVSETTGDSFYV